MLQDSAETFVKWRFYCVYFFKWTEYAFEFNLLSKELNWTKHTCFGKEM